MSQENLELARRTFESFQAGMARGDPGAAFDSGEVSPDCEWVPFRGLPGPQSYRGREGFVEFMRTWTEDFEGWAIEIERWIEGTGNRIVALVHQSATGHGSGVPVELHFATVYELEAGRVTRIANYADPAEALEAAGLSEQAMSQENVEAGSDQRLLERFRTNYLAFVEAFNRRDLETAFSRTPRDFVFEISASWMFEGALDMLSPAVMHSREELIAFYRDWIEQFPDWHVDVEGFAEPTPGVLLVTFTARGTGRVSGVPTDSRITEVWETRSRPIRVSQHRKEAEALEAAGLSE